MPKYVVLLVIKIMLFFTTLSESSHISNTNTKIIAMVKIYQLLRNNTIKKLECVISLTQYVFQTKDWGPKD